MVQKRQLAEVGYNDDHEAYSFIDLHSCTWFLSSWENWDVMSPFFSPFEEASECRLDCDIIYHPVAARS